MTNELFEVNNPANQEIIAQVPNMTPADALRAVDKAHAALPAWKSRTGKDRAQLLRRWFELMNRDADRLARLMTEEQGKAFMEAIGEVTYAASFIEWIKKDSTS